MLEWSNEWRVPFLRHEVMSCTQAEAATQFYTYSISSYALTVVDSLKVLTSSMMKTNIFQTYPNYV